jgi:hypothetical protein
LIERARAGEAVRHIGVSEASTSIEEELRQPARLHCYCKISNASSELAVRYNQALLQHTRLAKHLQLIFSSKFKDLCGQQEVCSSFANAMPGHKRCHIEIRPCVAAQTCGRSRRACVAFGS